MTRRSGLWVPPATAAWMRASHLSQAGDVDLLDSSVVRYLDASTAKGAGGARSQGVKWWRDLARQWGIAECQALSVFASRADQLRVESYLMRYAVWLVDVRQTQVETARKYYYEVNSWHAFEHGEFTPGYGMPRLVLCLKGCRSWFLPRLAFGAGRCALSASRWGCSVAFRGALTLTWLTLGLRCKWSSVACSAQRSTRSRLGRRSFLAVISLARM